MAKSGEKKIVCTVCNGKGKLGSEYEQRGLVGKTCPVCKGKKLATLDAIIRGTMELSLKSRSK